MNHIPHGLGCAWGLPGVMVYSAKYGNRSDLEIVADALGVSYTDKTDTMDLANEMAQIFVDFMREIGIKSIKSLGYSLENCLAVTERFFHDGAFANSPGTPGVPEIQEFIKYTYHIYQ